MLNRALQYAREFRVFPVGTDKRPYTEHGLHDATQNEEQIRVWWEQWPDANIALNLPEDVAVIDIDPRNGGRRDSFDFPETYEVRTPSGGWHLYYRVPGEVRVRGQLATGIDVKRGGKGYVLAPPSVGANGIAYQVVGPDYIENIPDEIFELIRKDREPEAGSFQFDGGTTYGLRALEGELGRVATAQEGERNAQLNASSFALGQLVAADQLVEDVVVERLSLAAERAGLDAEEIERTIRSGLEAGMAEPRDIPASSPAFAFEDDGDDFWMDWQAEDDPVEWLMAPYIPAHSYVLVFGPTQASKSMVTRWMAAKLSHEGVRVSYYSLENPSAVDRRDLKRLRPSADLEFFRITNRMLNLAEPTQVEALVAREQGRDLVILDTYAHAYWPAGSTGDENLQAINFARIVRYIIKRTGATVVVIDHSGFEVRDDPRGASAKRQQVDVAIAMTSEPWAGPPAPAEFVMRNTKAARFSNPFVVRGEIRDTRDGGLMVHLEEGVVSRAGLHVQEQRRNAG